MHNGQTLRGACKGHIQRTVALCLLGNNQRRFDDNHGIDFKTLDEAHFNNRDSMFEAVTRSASICDVRFFERLTHLINN